MRPIPILCAVTLIWMDMYEHHGQDSAWTKLLTLNLQRVFNLTKKSLLLRNVKWRSPWG